MIQAPGFNIGFSFGKLKQRSQMCELFTDDGQIKVVEYDVLKSCVDDPLTGVGYLLDADDQFMAKDRQWYQILYEKSSLPVCLIANPTIMEEQLTTVLEQIYTESQEAAKEHQYNIAKKNAWADRITLIVAMGVSGAIIMWAIQIFGAKSG